MAWGKNGTPDTNSGDVLTISNMVAKIFNIGLIHVLQNGQLGFRYFCNNVNTGTKYAERYSYDGGADGTEASRIDMFLNSASETADQFAIVYGCFIVNEEKLMMGCTVTQNVAGKYNAPHRVEYVAKYVPTSLNDTITRIDVDKGTDTGTFAASSNLSQLGTD